MKLFKLYNLIKRVNQGDESLVHIYTAMVIEGLIDFKDIPSTLKDKVLYNLGKLGVMDKND